MIVEEEKSLWTRKFLLITSRLINKFIMSNSFKVTSIFVLSVADNVAKDY